MIAMHLLVIRHGIAFERDPERWPDDRERPLTRRGVRRMRRAGPGFKRLVGTVGALFTSPWRRARETALILAETAGWPEPRELAELTPEHSPEQTLHAIREQTGDCIALVGHEPHASTLIAACLAGARGGTLGELRKGGAAALCFDARAEPGAATLDWLLTPRQLRLIGRAR